MNAPSASPSAAMTQKRKPALLAATGLTLVAALGYGLYWTMFERHVESTDNAYVQAPIVQITPQVAGTVVAVLVEDTAQVQAGQVLVKLDATDAKLALGRAEAQLAQTIRELGALSTNNAAFTANIKLREAEVSRMQADVARAADDVSRRQPLVATGAVSAEELKHAEAALNSARSALVSAQSALSAAREQAASNRVLTDGTPLDKHPQVERARAAVEEAKLALQRTELTAPVTGQVAKRTVQLGQRIAAGAPLMAVIPLDQVWVEANFKEVQLRQMRLGQPVHLRSDLYGNPVEYHGKVVGLGAGTGAAFALLPSQNATGNWIKVVQRVPVRIALEPKELLEHPLRLGLSMEVSVDVSPLKVQP
ncbi:efflux RND transporter periplasmic adaptor subunit [Leptothrix ochracea]|uniref:HlyD family secretion protein n=1 Tax=Leptothrix ochracea TaxID=735331 RepID=UPI0034E227D2